jgi:hypothetical protein
MEHMRRLAARDRSRWHLEAVVAHAFSMDDCHDPTFGDNQPLPNHAPTPIKKSFYLPFHFLIVLFSNEVTIINLSRNQGD